MEKNNLSKSLPKTSSAVDNDDSDRIQYISDEKWEQIFCKLNKEDVAQARLVCSNWRTVIDKYYKFSITIGERPFEELPVPFKVTTCSIHQLKKDADKIFKYPYNVEHLQLVDKVTPFTLRSIFNETSNIKDLDFANSYNVEKAEICMPEEPVLLKNLLHLKVHPFDDFDQRYNISNTPFTNTKRIFSYEMSSINRLDVRFHENLDKLDMILQSFFEFLAKHSKTVKQLRASFIPEIIFDEHPTQLSEELFNKILPQNIIQRLHDPEFQVTTLILPLPIRYLRLWDRIINNQKKLITFYNEYNDDPFLESLYLAPFGTIRPTLVRNASTLVNVHLAHITLEINQNRLIDKRQLLPIDGLLFKNFNKLRRLMLRRCITDYLHHPGIQIEETSFVNVSSISSEFLEVLEIGSFVCESNELKRLVENAPRLKIATFHFTGNVDGKGVTPEIIDDLRKKSDIQIIDVCPLKLPPSNTEAHKKLVEHEKQYPQEIQIGVTRNDRSYYFNFDRFRNGREQESFRPQYKHPFYFE